MGDARETLDGQLHDGMEGSEFSTHLVSYTTANPTAEECPRIVLQKPFVN